VFLLVNNAGSSGVAQGVEACRLGAPLLDVVEAVLRAAESDRSENSLGLGCFPNALGRVELDASVMDGSGRRTGSVAALQGFLHPISVARQVMERLPHELLAGEGAAVFAEEIGAEKGTLLTPEMESLWRAWWERGSGMTLPERVWKTAVAREQRDTAIVLAGDQGALVSGTSTGGWAYKYPGRIGDSPIIGSGHYADSEFGAAACTHTGEMTIRAGTSRAVVLALSAGMTPEQACRRGIEDLRRLRGGFLSDVVIYAVDPRGNHQAATTGVEGDYWWWESGRSRAERREAARVD
jgi:beta-aspartyl-peptidase (threonine type)